MSTTGHNTLSRALSVYDECRRKGEWARIVLETRDGARCVNLSIQLPAGSTADAGKRGECTGEMEKTFPRRKSTPSRIWRNAARREAWLNKKKGPLCENRVETDGVHENMDTDNNKDQSVVTEAGVEEGGSNRVGEEHLENNQLIAAADSPSASECVWQVSPPDDTHVDTTSVEKPDQCEEEDSDEEVALPETVTSLKFFANDFKISELPEIKIHEILSKKKITVRNISVLSNTQGCCPTIIFWVEIEDFSYSSVRELQSAVDKRHFIDRISFNIEDTK